MQTSPIGLAATLRLPSVAPLLGICFFYMTAFYGVYAFFGDFIRHLLDLSAPEAGGVVLAYGGCFGLGGLISIALSKCAPSPSPSNKS